MRSEIERMMHRRYGTTGEKSTQEKPVCKQTPYCKGCPYPAHGFICWTDRETCMRMENEKKEIQRQETKL